MTKQRPRRARVLTNIRVDEISCVDKGAGEGVKIVMMKRAGKPDYEAFFARIFGVEKKDTRKNLDVHVDPDGPVNPGGDDADDVNSRRARGDDDDETERLSADADDDNEKGNTMKTLMGLAKQYGWQAVAKNFVENGTGSFSETEVTEFLTTVAQKAYPGERSDVAFAKLYSAPTPDGELMRRTTQAARDAQFISRTSKAQPQFSDRSSKPFHAAGAVDGRAGRPGVASLRPRVTGGRAAQAVDDPRSALDQLKSLADEQRRNHPTLSEAGAFAAVYQDPKNADLAARERAENRPTAAR